MALQRPSANQLQRCACYSYQRNDAVATATLLEYPPRFLRITMSLIRYLSPLLAKV